MAALPNRAFVARRTRTHKWRLIVEQANRSAFFRALQQTTHKTPTRDSRTEPPITTPAFVQQAAPDLGVCIFPTLVAGLRFNPPAHALALSVSVRSTILNSCTHPKQNRRRRRCPSPHPTRPNTAQYRTRPAPRAPPPTSSVCQRTQRDGCPRAAIHLIIDGTSSRNSDRGAAGSRR